MTPRLQRTLGLLLLAVGVIVIALGRFSAAVPAAAVWVGLATIVVAWLLIGLSFRRPNLPDR